MRLLERLGDHIARREIVVLAVELPAFPREHRDDGFHRLLPTLALVAHFNAEWMQLGRPRRLAHAELDTAAREQVERCHLFGDAMRVVGGELDHAVAEPDALGALAGGTQEHFRRGGVRILLEEVMLDLPSVVVAEFVGQFDLRQRILQELVFAPRAPRPRQLVFVEDAEFHDCDLTRLCRSWRCSRSVPGPSAGERHGPSRERSRAWRPARGSRRHGRPQPAATDRRRRAAPASAPSRS